MRKNVVGFILIIQSILLLVHFFLYQTWAFATAGGDSSHWLATKLVLRS